MTQPTVRVTGETRDLGDHWECSAYGGPFENPISVRVEAANEVAVKALFITEWNAAAGTSWAPEEFAFEHNSG